MPTGRAILGITTGSLLVSGLMFLTLSGANIWAWNGTEGCSTEFWKSALHEDTRTREIVGINVNNAVEDVTDIRLGDYSAFDGFQDLTNDEALDLAGDNQVEEFYKQLGAGIFNIYYGADRLDYIEPSTEFRDIIQVAVDEEDIERATNELEAANNLGCPLDHDGNTNSMNGDLSKEALTITTSDDIGAAIINSGPEPDSSNIQLPEGYQIEPVLWNLTLSSAVTFDDDGTMYVVESGFIYGGFTPTPKIFKIDQNGNVSTFVDRMLQAPITDIEFNPDDGLIYVSHRATISTIDSNGIVKDVITGLPIPDIAVHHNNQIAFGNDGKLYVGIGSVTNSGVMSPNLKDLGMKNNPDMHDIPARDITLTGQNFVSDNPLTPDPTDETTTGAFVPFGTETEEGQVIEGEDKCQACVIKANTDGTELEVIAWVSVIHMA